MARVFLEAFVVTRTITSGKTSVSAIRACSYGEKLSQLARKHFDKFTNDI